MVVHVYHPYRQPDGINHCLPLNGRCSHICVPAPQLTINSAKTSCLCPHGLKLEKDGLNCERDGELNSNFRERLFYVIAWINFQFTVSILLNLIPLSLFFHHFMISFLCCTRSSECNFAGEDHSNEAMADQQGIWNKFRHYWQWFDWDGR